MQIFNFMTLIVSLLLMIACSNQSPSSSESKDSMTQDRDMLSSISDMSTATSLLDMGTLTDMLSSPIDMDSSPMDMMSQIQEEDLGPPIPGIDPEFIMDEIQLLTSSEGFDLNGDSIPDNGLALLFEDEFVGGVLGGDPNEYIARSIRRAKLLLLLDFYRFDDFNHDELVSIDIFLGRDADNRRANNFNGTEFFVSCSSLTDTGQADSQFTRAQIIDRHLQGDGGQFRFLISFGNTEVLMRQARVKGLFTDDNMGITDGMLGGAVHFDDLEAVVRNDPEIGDGFAQVMLNFLEARLDIDLDEDGRPDSLSAAFSFTAVPAIIKRESPCVE